MIDWTRGMQIKAVYSHLNGREWLQVHRATFWNEIEIAVKNVDAASCRTKISKEKNSRHFGKKIYAPDCLNKAFKTEFDKLSWLNASKKYFYVCEDAKTNTDTLQLPLEDQKTLIESRGFRAIRTSNAADFYKERVSLEVQLGKYFAVQFDIFNKHAANYMQGRIDLGIEIVPMKSLEEEMSSGPPYFEKHVHEIVRQGRIFPPVPLILIGIDA